MTIGAIAAAVLGLILPGTWSRWLLIPVVMIASMLAGALYGAIPGYLKARFDASEIVTTLMLNFVAFNAAAWVIFEVFPEGFVQRTESIQVERRAPSADGRVVRRHRDLHRHRRRLRRLVHHAQDATRFLDPSHRRQHPAHGLAGIRAPKVTVQAFLLAGAFAGLAGALIVQGRDHSLLQDFSANFGFVGHRRRTRCPPPPAMGHRLAAGSSPSSESAATASRRERAYPRPSARW